MFTGGVRDSAELEISNLETDENRVRSIFVRFRTKVRPAPLRGSEGSRVTGGRAVFFKSHPQSGAKNALLWIKIQSGPG
jgi:hypothetical protein